MMIMSPLTGEGKPLDVSARLAELTGFVYEAARDGLPAHELERGLWSRLLQVTSCKRPISPSPATAIVGKRCVLPASLLDYKKPTVEPNPIQPVA